MAKILIVEDDDEILQSIELVLRLHGHTLECATDGQEGVDRLKLYNYDLVVLDINLPKLSGHEVLRSFRSAGGSSPVLMLTAQASIESRVAGLDGGADDYLLKPFNADELAARVRALLRRETKAKTAELQCGEITLDTVSRKVTVAGKEVHLLPKEFALLEFFMRHQGQHFSAEAILDRVWSSESDSTKDAVRVWIKRLRDKLGGPDGKAPIYTELGVGYIMKSP